MNNLEDFRQLPTGCGEQNLEGLLPPAIMLVDYLRELGRTSSSFTGRAAAVRLGCGHRTTDTDSS